MAAQVAIGHDKARARSAVESLQQTKATSRGTV